MVSYRWVTIQNITEQESKLSLGSRLADRRYSLAAAASIKTIGLGLFCTFVFSILLYCISSCFPFSIYYRPRH